MPTLFPSTLFSPRRAIFGGLSALIATFGLAALPAASSASTRQISIIEDPSVAVAPDSVIPEFRELGANTIRVIVPWSKIAPSPNKTKMPKFNATDPNAYAPANWVPYDTIVRDAQADGMTVDFTVTGGAPRWAEGKNVPKAGLDDVNFAWEPNAKEFGQFVQAVATRYDGSFTPKGASSVLPAVKFWAIWNEPNFGEDLGPQATDTSRILSAAPLYRSLVDAGWTALQKHHKGQTILIGSFAARGFYLSNGKHSKKAPQGYPGNYGQTRPQFFLRDLYCVGSNFKPLRGTTAKQLGCPTNAAGTRAFRSKHPGLFNATGMADHPYANVNDPVHDDKLADYGTFPELPNMLKELDKLNKAYGSKKKFPIYNDEYGYITNPPNKQIHEGKHYPSQATAAGWLNWAEYLSWKNPRIASYMQYLLRDPSPNAGAYSGFASGLEDYSGHPKATYDAFRLPVYMPKTSFSASTSAELWGDARPAPFEAKTGTAQSVQVQLNGTTIDTVPINSAGGYFDTHIKFPSSGSVRLAYTYPSTDPLLPTGVAGTTVYSRSFNVTVH